MLDVSDAIKNAYLQSNVPVQLKLVIDGTTYTARNITAGSVSITESLCSLETFDISSVEKNELEFSLFNETQAISDLVGKTVVASHVMTLNNTTEEIPLGTYTIVTSEYDTDYVIKCVCYDAMLNFDKIIDDWWNTQVQFPITIGNLVTQLFQYVGVTSDLPATYNNYDFVVSTRTAFLENTKASELLGQIQEVVGGFFKADRYGVIRLLAPTTTMGLYPRIGLYPHNGLYPSNGGIGYGEDSENVNYNCRQIFGELTTADYTVQAIDKVQIRGTEEDIGIIIGTGTNTYVIQGNILLYGLTDAQGQTVGQNIYNALSVLTYIPFNGTFKALPYVEVGDSAFVTSREGITAKAPILYRVLSDQKLSMDNFVAKGAKERPVVKDVNKRITVLNQRTHEIINTVEELSSTITNVETEVAGLETITTTHTTQIAQNANEISFTANRTGIFNMLVNSDFTNQTDRTQGWITSKAGTVEYLYDEDFIPEEDQPDFNHIEDGHCLKITTSETGNGYIIQRLNYNGSISQKIGGQVTYRMTTKNATAIQLFIHIYAGSTSLIYAFVGTEFGDDGKTHCVRFLLTDAQMQSLEGQTITLIEYGIFMSGMTDTNVFEINHLLLTFSDDALPFYSWTNIPSRNLISQINLDPTGLRINANKITVDTTSLDLTFGSAQSSVTIQATPQDDGIFFDGDGRVVFETEGEFYAKNLDSSDNIANQIRMRSHITISSADTNQVGFLNRRNNVTVNEFYANASDTSAQFRFYNNFVGTTYYANNHVMEMSSTATLNRLNNWDYKGVVDNTSWSANYVQLYSNATENRLLMDNYDGEGHESNWMRFRSYKNNASEYNTIWICNNRHGYASNANNINMTEYQSAYRFNLNNYNYNHLTSSNVGTSANHIGMYSDADYNSAGITNYDVNGNTRNMFTLISRKDENRNAAQIWNHHTNGQVANMLSMGSTNNAAGITLANFDDSGNIRTGLFMNADGSFSISTRTGGTSIIQVSTNGNLDLIGNNVTYLGPSVAGGYVAIKTKAVNDINSTANATYDFTYWDTDGYLRGGGTRHNS